MKGLLLVVTVLSGDRGGTGQDGALAVADESCSSYSSRQRPVASICLHREPL